MHVLFASLAMLLAMAAAGAPACAADQTRRQNYNGETVNGQPEPVPRPRHQSRSYEVCVSHAHSKCESDLQRAIKKSRSGGLIVVSKGYETTLTKSLTIDKPLTICSGSIEPRLQCQPSSYLAPPPQLSIAEGELFTLNHSGSDACIRIDLQPWPESHTGRVIIEGMKLTMRSKTPTPSCIWVKSGQFKLRHSILTSCTGSNTRQRNTRPLCHQVAAPAIRLDGGDAEIIGTSISNTSAAVFLVQGHEATVILRNNRFWGNDYGIHMNADHTYLFAAENWLHRNRIDGARINAGLAVLVRNRITENRENGVRTSSTPRAALPDKREEGFSGDVFPLQLLENDIRDNQSHAVKIHHGARVLANANCLIHNRRGTFSTPAQYEQVRNLEWSANRERKALRSENPGACRGARGSREVCERVRRACFEPPRNYARD